LLWISAAVVNSEQTKETISMVVRYTILYYHNDANIQIYVLKNSLFFMIFFKIVVLIFSI